MEPKEKYDQFILNEINRNTTYHSQKENTAWLATTFYIVGIISMGWFSHQLIATDFLSCECSINIIKAVLCVIIFLLFICITLFLVFQYCNRKIASNRVSRFIGVYLEKSQVQNENKELIENKLSTICNLDCIGTGITLNIIAVSMAIIISTSIAILLVILS